MRFINAKFIKSASARDGFILDDFPQIAVVGRSNVGKSSLINMLTNNKKMAKTSATPGRTRLVNYFSINNTFYLVDLPGYGFNKASKTTAGGWDRLLNDYFTENERLKLVLLLIDSRISATALDIQMLDYLAELEIPVAIVLTKIDKISRSELNLTKQKIMKELRFNLDRIICVSASKKIGTEEIATLIENYI